MTLGSGGHGQSSVLRVLYAMLVKASEQGCDLLRARCGIAGVSARLVAFDALKAMNTEAGATPASTNLTDGQVAALRQALGAHAQRYWLPDLYVVDEVDRECVKWQCWLDEYLTLVERRRGPRLSERQAACVWLDGFKTLTIGPAGLWSLLILYEQERRNFPGAGSPLAGLVVGPALAKMLQKLDVPVQGVRHAGADQTYVMRIVREARGYGLPLRFRSDTTPVAGDRARYLAWVLSRCFPPRGEPVIPEILAARLRGKARQPDAQGRQKLLPERGRAGKELSEGQARLCAAMEARIARVLSGWRPS